MKGRGKKARGPPENWRAKRRENSKGALSCRAGDSGTNTQAEGGQRYANVHFVEHSHP
jgi:hypothetical protein